MIDLDNFKQANDTYGHAYGDEILKTFVQCTKKMLRSKDIIIRLGGDEFLLIFMGIQELQARVVIKRITNKIAKTKLGQNLVFSYGLTFVEDMTLLLDYIDEADARMYINKMSKKNNK
jgi:diguanylate cyclase (GGDEF)-like protein